MDIGDKVICTKFGGCIKGGPIGYVGTIESISGYIHIVVPESLGRVGEITKWCCQPYELVLLQKPIKA